MKKRFRAFLFLPALTCFSLASCGSKTEEERCSYLHELAKPSAIDTTNELGSFSGGNLGKNKGRGLFLQRDLLRLLA